MLSSKGLTSEPLCGLENGEIGVTMNQLVQLTDAEIAEISGGNTISVVGYQFASYSHTTDVSNSSMVMVSSAGSGAATAELQNIENVARDFASRFLSLFHISVPIVGPWTIH